MSQREKAQEWVEKQIRKTRVAIGNAESKPNVSHTELANLNDTLATLEWLSQLVLGAKEL